MEKKTLQKIAYICVILTCIIVTFKVLTCPNNPKKRYEDYTNVTPPLAGPNNLVLTDNLGNLSSIQFPPGIILAWKSGADADNRYAPAGWAICDGTNNTPDLRGRFILGANPNNNKNPDYTTRETDETGGKETTSFTLTVSNIPAHKHKLSPIEANGARTFPTQWGSGSGGSMAADNWGNNSYNGDYYTDNTGGGTAVTGIPIMPPFYTLIYIMKL